MLKLKIAKLSAYFRRLFGRCAPTPEQQALAFISQGNRLEDAGMFEQAMLLYEAAVLASPALPVAHLNHGNILLEAGDIHGALAAYRTALEYDPLYAAAHYNTGNAFLKLAQRDDAVVAYRRAIELNADFADARVALACALDETRGTEDSEAGYRGGLEQAVAHDPLNASARWALAVAHLRPIYDTVNDVETSRRAFAVAVDQLAAWFTPEREALGRKAIGTTWPFNLAYQAQDNLELLRPFGRLCSRLMRDGTGMHMPVHLPVRRSHKLRIGFASAQLYDHSVWNAITKGWIMNLDAGRFEVYVFQLTYRNDDETARTRLKVAHYLDKPRTATAWAQTIANAALDALIFPEIGMDALTVQLASQRLAPMQAASWGHPHTTALPTIDLFISADLLEPPNGEAHYLERLVRLPNLGVYVEPLEPEITEIDLATMALPVGEPLLLCPGMPFKYTPDHDSVWVALAKKLQEFGTGRLVFFRCHETAMDLQLERRLRGVFAVAGVDFDRTVCLIPKLPRDQFFGLMRQSCLMLDTIGFSGFNTALQGLECGLPLVAYQGEFMRGRLASGLLRRLGLDEWIATSNEEFIAKAIQLVTDCDAALNLRQLIADRKARIFSDLEPVRALEQVIIQGARRTGETP